MDEPAIPDLSEFTNKEPAAPAEGRLKIFLGMCAGVGKTYAMLQEAQKALQEGTDIIIGLVETHNRKETAALLEGLPVVPKRPINYRGVILQEMDLDALLVRRPQFAVVDELAHSNIPGSRHSKRYQDVLELLKSGIHVLTTLNVQHLESRADIVHQITGAIVQETVPDSILDRADDIQIVDIPPERLRERLAEGKVYLGEAAGLAAENFFKHENLTALREMALRVTAERADSTLRDVMRNRGIQGPWKAAERLMVCIGTSPSSEKLVRWTRRIASALDCSWIAVYAETDGETGTEEKQRIARHLSLVRRLGGEPQVIPGHDPVKGILRAAREKNVTQIVIGKSHEPFWRSLLQGGSLTNKLIRQSGLIDIYVVQPDKTLEKEPRKTPSAVKGVQPAWLPALGITGLLTAIFFVFQKPLGYTAIAPLFLLWIVISGLKYPRRIVLTVATLSALLWNFIFIPPFFTLAISQVHDMVMFLMFFVVALAIGHLTTRLRSSERAEERREKRSSALFNLVQQAGLAPDLPSGLTSAVALLDNLLRCKTAILLRLHDRSLAQTAHPASSLALADKERNVAEWVFTRSMPAGRFTDTLPNSDCLHLPLKARTGIYGVLSIQTVERQELEPAERELLETSAGLIAAILEKDHIIQAFKRAEVVEASDQLRRALLDSVSHELKTPLAALQTGFETLLYKLPLTLIPEKEAADEIKMSLKRLRRVIENLLDMTRIQAGVIQPKLDWAEPDEIVQSAIELAGDALHNHPMNINHETPLPLIKVDQALLEQALSNLLVNAAVWSPDNSPVTVNLSYANGQFSVSVMDEGPGLSPEDIKRVFEKFYRGPNAPTGGTGLGLSIVEGFVRAHDGKVSVANREGKGACFTMHIPAKSLSVEAEDALK
ncbi:MAG: sensor histidine kinase KdpD [Fibrobacterota bacterium]